MKDMKDYMRLMLLACCVFFVACSDDDDETVQPVFPQSQTLSCAVGDEQVLTFEATNDWTLTSSALWCSFRKGDEQVYSYSGNAGKQSVTVYVSDDASELLKSYEAELTLIMGGQRQVICKVTRPVIGYEVKVFNEDETVEFTLDNPMIQDYDGKQKLVVAANFDWKVVLPEALSSDVVSGLAGEKVVLKPSLVKGFTKEAWQATLNFKNKENEVVTEAPVKYDGIPADRVEFSVDNPLGTTITFSTWGDSYKIGEVEHEGEMPLTVTAREDKYTIVYVDYKEKRNDLTWEYEYEFTRLPEEDAWFFTEDDQKGNIQLGAGYNNEQARTGYLMVFPNAAYDQVKDDFETVVFSTQGIIKPYDNYVAARIAQVANPRFTTGFTVTDDEGNPLYGNYGEIEAMSYENAGIWGEEEVVEMFGTSNVYFIDLPLGTAYENILVKPNGFTGMYIQPDTYMNGHDTAWDGVEVAMNFGEKGVNIYGIGADTNGADMMVIKCLDGGEAYAVLLLFTRN